LRFYHGLSLERADGRAYLQTEVTIA
jgi:hypothetical protein